MRGVPVRMHRRARAIGCTRPVALDGVAAAVSSVEVQGSPVAVAAVGGTAWVALPERRSLWREGTDPVPVPGRPLDLVETLLGVWVVLADESDGVDVSLALLDASTGEVVRQVSLSTADTAPVHVSYDGLGCGRWTRPARASSCWTRAPGRSAAAPWSRGARRNSARVRPARS